MFRSLFSRAKSDDRRETRQRSARLALEPLEGRDLMASIILNTGTGVLRVVGSGQDDTASVIAVTGYVQARVMTFSDAAHQVKIYDETKAFPVSSVNRIDFHGFAGNDRFTNYSSIECKAYGDAGNDRLYGGEGNDFLVGGHGHDGLQGNAGLDKLYGGAGSNNLKGGSGNDLIVSIGGGVDVIAGGPQWDSVWMDTTDNMTDISAGEQYHRYIHKVDQFLDYSYDGGSTSIPVSKELNGQSLKDPSRIPDPDTARRHWNYKSNPLFADGGPSKDDVFQGSVGDCYFVVALSAAAGANPEFIKNMVVDLGDGTYAVRFYRDGEATFVRVDADLWVDDAGTLLYAKLGQDESIWAPIVEKAYCFFRKRLGSYPSIASGGSGALGSLDEHLGVATIVRETGGSVSPQQVIAWDLAGRPAGAIADQIRTKAVALLNWIKWHIAAGDAVVLGAVGKYNNSTALALDNPSTTDVNEKTWRRGQHIFAAHEVLTDASGNPTGLVIRNPYGTQGPNEDGYITITDLTRIYFCNGGARSYLV